MNLVPSGFAPDDTGKTRTDNLNVLSTSYGFSAVMKDLKILLVDKIYVTNILGNHFSCLHLCRRMITVYCLPVTVFFRFSGYIAYNFVLGAYSYWGPKAGYNIYKMVRNYQNSFRFHV